KRCLAFKQEDRPADGAAVAGEVARIRQALQQPDEALEWYGKAIERLKPLFMRPEAPVPVTAQRDMLQSLCRCGELLHARGKLGPALKYWDKALELTGAAHPGVRLRRARTLAASGEYTGAVDEAIDLSARTQQPEELYGLAQIYALAASAAAKSPRLTAERQT